MAELKKINMTSVRINCCEFCGKPLEKLGSITEVNIHNKNGYMMIYKAHPGCQDQFNRMNERIENFQNFTKKELEKAFTSQ